MAKINTCRRRNHSDAKNTRMYIVRDYANTDNMYAYAIVCTTDGTYDGTEYHVIKSYVTGYLEAVRKGERHATPESRGKKIPNWKRDVIYSCFQLEEAEEYIAEIAHYKSVHFSQRYTNMCNETSRRSLTPIKSGVVPVSRREQKRREKTAHSLAEKGAKLSTLKKHGYAPAPVDLPEGLPESYGDDVTQWSREKRDELERRNVLRKYGYSV